MVNLIDKLSDEDKDIITQYAITYGTKGLGFCGIDEYLKEWNKSKTTLYHLLGDTLDRVVPIDLSFNSKYIENRVEDGLYDNINPVYTFRLEYLDWLYNHKNRLNEDYSFDAMFYKYYYENFNEQPPFGETNGVLDGEIIFKLKNEGTGTPATTRYLDRYYDFRDLLESYVGRTSLINNTVQSSTALKYKKDGKTLQITKGMKLSKAWQKINNFFHITTPEVFEAARVEYSMWFNESKKGYLHFSIHPMDFITMSHNASGWHSCMSWAHSGEFKTGSVEMLNSNNVLCVFLTTKPDDRGLHFKSSVSGDELSWNDKKWRTLVIVEKDIIVANKAYPYQNADVAQFAITDIRMLAEENLNWHYEFGPEKYLDMGYIDSDSFLSEMSDRIRIGAESAKKHHIVFKSNGMYNDMLANSRDYDYWCYRNKVKKAKLISYSGKTVCLCCGKTNYLTKNEYSYDDSNDTYSDVDKLLCGSCYNEGLCTNCGEFCGADRIIAPNGIMYCRECGADKYYCPTNCGNSAILTNYCSFDNYNLRFGDTHTPFFIIVPKGTEMPKTAREILRYNNRVIKDIERFDVGLLDNSVPERNGYIMARPCPVCNNKYRKAIYDSGKGTFLKLNAVMWGTEINTIVPVIKEEDFDNLDLAKEKGVSTEDFKFKNTKWIFEKH